VNVFTESASVVELQLRGSGGGTTTGTTTTGAAGVVAAGQTVALTGVHD